MAAVPRAADVEMKVRRVSDDPYNNVILLRMGNQEPDTRLDS